jgi:hypothetical protein
MKPPASCRAACKPPRAFLDCLRQFLTPQAWKQAQQHAPNHRPCQRWSVHNLVLTLLALSWCCGDSLPERFETARAFCLVCRCKRRRPGQTVTGFHKALARLPLPALRALAAGVRAQLERHFADSWQCRNFVPFGCDGSRVACPRSAELEGRLGQGCKDGSAPMLWVTALVHLRTGLLWSWRLGKGTASELVHLKHLLAVLPPTALLVADAAFLDYQLYAALMGAGRSFLIRMSSRACLYVDAEVPLERFREGLVYYWPLHVRERGQPPLRLRLLRIKGHKADVWLLTDVLDRQRLGRKAAGQLYRWRWRNEGLFRIYKRTINKVKLSCRSVRAVHREAEGSLLAVQLLLAQGLRAVRRGARGAEVACSARGVLVAIRQEIMRVVGQGLGPRQWQDYERRLGQARVEERERRSAKERRPWPRRKPHKPPKPPRIRVLSDALKARLAKELNAA